MDSTEPEKEIVTREIVTQDNVSIVKKSAFSKRHLKDKLENWTNRNIIPMYLSEKWQPTYKI